MSEPPHTADATLRAALEGWRLALERPADVRGGDAITVVSSSEPPAVAHLTSASVRLRGEVLQVAVMSASTMARVPSRTLTALTCLDGAVLRLGALVHRRTEHGHITVLDALVESAAVTREDPWLLESRFVSSDLTRGEALVGFWAALRSWLDGGCAGAPPAHPAPGGAEE
jgi:hypothetical protein